MAVLRTESRIPSGLDPSELGQAAPAADGRCALISFATSPIVVGRDNVYVLMITDSALAATSDSYEWSFVLDAGAADIRTSRNGEISYRSPATGSLKVTVRILDASNAEQARLDLDQDIVSPSEALELLIEEARNAQGPTVTNPDTARELINEHNIYYQSVEPAASDPGDAFRTFLFTLVHDGALEQPPAARRRKLDRLAASLNEGGDFAALVGGGFGLCGLRMGLLAMTSPPAAGGTAPALNWTELPEPAAPRAAAEAALRDALGALDADTRVDLFNRARFPKSNIAHCARMLEALRDRYFSGVSFSDAMTGLSGTRAHWIVRHFREGPLLRE